MSDESQKEIAREERQSGFQVLKSVAPYLWAPEFSMRARVVLALVALLLSNAIIAATPYFFGVAVDALSGENSLNYWVALGPVVLVVIYGIFRAAGLGFAQLRDFLFAPVAQRALRMLALETFEHIHNLSLRYHLTRKTGSMIRVVERGVKGVEFLLRFMLFSLGPLVLQLILMLIIFWVAFDWRYCLVTLGVIVVYVWFTFSVTEMRVRIRRQMNEADQRANQRALDSLLNFETVKYFNAERPEAERYDMAMAGYEKAAISTSNTLAGLNFGQAFIISVGIVIVMLMAVWDVRAGVLTVGDFVMVNAYMIQITTPLNFLGTVYREIRQSLVDMADMFNLLSQDPEIKDDEDARELVVSKGEVAFEDVDFGYEDDRQILHKLSLTLPAGKTTAVVGPSGSGKSTLARLIYRFYDPVRGRISIDGQDLRDVSQHSLRAALGIVPQDTVLFNDTIGYNIAYGRLGATHEEVVEVAKAAQIHDFIMRLPNGYETEVGERGLKLSGGEKQRVGIARTLLKNPPILILDEATSALDTQTEQGILGALRRMAKGRTVLTIAHRLSTVVDADEIIVLVQGRIEERGTHSQLLKAGNRYAQMWEQQQAEEHESPSAAE